MATGFEVIFASLKPILGKYSGRLSVKADSSTEYTLITNSPSPFPQNKGQPLNFGSDRMGKAYVSFHLMALYMNPTITNTISQALTKRMQGKTCFNFKVNPEPEVLSELERLTDAGFEAFKNRNWL